MKIIEALTILVFLAFSSTVWASGEIDIGGVLKSGPVDEAGYTVAASVEEGNLSAFGKYHYAARNNLRYDEKGHIGLNYNVVFTDSPVSLWLYDKVVFVDFARQIDLENRGGGGLKYTIPGLIDSASLSLSVGYLNHFTEYSDDSKTTVHRASIRPKASFKSGPWDLRWVGYYQPSMDEPEEDYILESTASAGYWLSELWGVKLARDDEYRSMIDKDPHSAETSVLFSRRW